MARKYAGPSRKTRLSTYRPLHLKWPGHFLLRLRAKRSELDYSLRPHSLAEFVGQERIKKVLAMSMAAARQRGEPLDDVLFSAPPGLGKTSLARIIARELGVNLHVTSGPAIERAGDLAAIVNDLDQGGPAELATRSRGTPRIARAVPPYE